MDPEEENGEIEFLRPMEVRTLAHKIRRVTQTSIAGIEVVSSDVPDQRIVDLIKHLHEDFDNVVFYEEIFSEPPVHVNFGFASIPLNQGAQSTRARPIVIRGERANAFKQIVDECLKAG